MGLQPQSSAKEINKYCLKPPSTLRFHGAQEMIKGKDLSGLENTSIYILGSKPMHSVPKLQYWWESCPSIPTSTWCHGHIQQDRNPKFFCQGSTSCCPVEYLSLAPLETNARSHSNHSGLRQHSLEYWRSWCSWAMILGWLVIEQSKKRQRRWQVNWNLVKYMNHGQVHLKNAAHKLPTTQFIYHVEPLANISWNKPVFSAQVKASFQTTAAQLRTLSRIFTFAKPVLCRCQSPSISAATGCADDGVEGHNAGLTHCCAPGIGDFKGFLTFLWKNLEGLGYSSVRLNRFKGTWSSYWHSM